MGNSSNDRGEGQSDGSFVRWQERTLQQVGTTVHVILTLSTGALAYVATLVLGKDAVHLGTAAAILMGLGASFFLFSVAAGLWVHWSRLNDFDWTARTARIRELGEELKLKNGAPAWPRWSYEESSVIRKCPNFTAKIKPGTASSDQPSEDDVNCVLKYCRDKSEKAGEWTWRLLMFQFPLFLMGMVFLVIGLGKAWWAAKPMEKDASSQYFIGHQTLVAPSEAGDHTVPEPHARIHFDFGQDTSRDTKEAIKELIAQVHELDRTVVEVEGFTDCIGSDKFNNKLSRRRAEGVVCYLRNRGVPEFRIHAVGLGKDKGCGEGAVEDHRRVEVSVLKLPEPPSALRPPR